jgi:hypothetical protein
MKLFRPALALMIVISVAGSASAQIGVWHRRGVTTAAVPANPQALNALQQDLITAIESMKAALPIYDGNRVHSIHSAHEALVVVDHAIAGANAPARQAPKIKSEGAYGTAKSTYSQQQIAVSQANMEKGYAALQQAWKDLQVAAGSNPNQKAVKVSNLLQTAGSEAKKAISLHGNQG